MALPTPTITYFLDGYSLHSYFGIYVKSTKGILDLPKMKPLIRHSWPDSPGESVYLRAPQFEAKEFSLDCFIQATSIFDFTQKLNTFLSAVTTPVPNVGTHRLQININASNPLVYQVYCPDGINVNARFSPNAQIGTFTIKFRCPEPLAKVCKYTAPPTTLTVNFGSVKRATIYWGDGTMNSDLLPYQSYTFNHTYSASGTYYIIIAGDVDSIFLLTGTGTFSTIWNKLF